MKKTVLLFAIISLSSHLFAATMIDCRDKGDLMSWSVTINSDLKLASFFDNDHEVALNRVGISFYESYPPQTVFDFKGQDKKAKIDFHYTQETKQGLLIANTGTPDEFQVDFECVTRKDTVDWKTVSKAIEDAHKNGGSTRYEP
jgi:hypothetical protein